MKILKRLLILVILAILCAGGYLGYRYNNNLKAMGDSSEEIQFSVNTGDSINTVIDHLLEDGLIHDKLSTQLYVRIKSIHSLQANDYILDPTMNLDEIFKVLVSGDFNHLVQSSMTIIDGCRIGEVAEVVGEKLGLSQEDVLAYWSDLDYIQTLIDDYPMLTDEIIQEGIKCPLEGYLYPETYSLTNVDQSLDSYTRLMLDQMQSVIDAYLAQIDTKNMSVHQFLSFCSVVEAESLYSEDKNMIAGVFYNRLNANMPFESDVTVLYALDEQRVDLTYADTEVESPYNTYLNIGVPIGPICNISLETLEACLNPAESNYYYFFALQDGTVLYSTTYEEHLQKVAENQWY